ncbi:MAG: S24 family peptidase [Leptospirillia bacterium]
MDAKAIRLYNLRRLISEAGGQKKLAQRAGVNPAYVSQILSTRTRRSMGDDVARRLESGMGKPHGWMDVIGDDIPVEPGGYQVARTGDAVVRDASDAHARYGSTEPVFGPAVRVPCISWVTAGHWADVVDSFQPGDADDWVETTKRVGRTVFALRVKGDSMEPRVPDGAVIIVDPETEAVNGSLVVARLDDAQEATFKKLLIEGNKRFLVPLNPRYPVIEITGPATVCGVVRQVLIDLD